MQCWVMNSWAQDNAVRKEYYISAGTAYTKLKMGNPRNLKKETKIRRVQRGSRLGKEGAAEGEKISSITFQMLFPTKTSRAGLKVSPYSVNY